MDKLYPNMAKGNLNEGQIDNLYLEYAKEKSGTLFAFEFIYQFFGPTGFKPEFFVEDNQGHLWGQATLYEEYIRIREENAGNDISTYNEFFETYGIEHPYMLSPRSKSETGKLRILASLFSVVLSFKTFKKFKLSKLSTSKKPVCVLLPIANMFCNAPFGVLKL